MSSSPVSRWLTQILEMTGIDINIYKGYSTRAASSAKADISRVSVSRIMKQGH